MPLPVLIQRLLRRAPASEGPQEERSASQPASSPDDIVTAARTRARRRLIGASVLLGAAVLVFSLAFESRPRPLPLDTPIEIASRPGGSTVIAAPAVKPVTPLPAPAASAPAAASAPSPAPMEPVEAESAASAPPPPTPRPAPPAKADARADSAVPSKGAAPATGSAAAAPEKGASRPAAAEGRFVVQVGAFADNAQVRDLRARLDKLGLRKHYVQAADAKGGQRLNRVRLGPFPTRDEADRAAARLKEAGLPGQVFEL